MQLCSKYPVSVFCRSDLEDRPGVGLGGLWRGPTVLTHGSAHVHARVGLVGQLPAQRGVRQRKQRSSGSQ